MALKNILKAWGRRAYGLLTLWTVVPSGVAAVIGAWLSTGVRWIAQFGAFGWFVSGLLCFVLAAVAFALLARTKLWSVEAASRARTLGDSSPFDPMANVYEDKRLYLRDLAPVGRRQVMGKKFINTCAISRRWGAGR